jgi:TatA/E family protein of Tat protein translocase
VLAVINDTGIVIAVLAVVVLFGASRLPKLARNLGEAGREFRKAHDEANPDTPPTPTLAAPERSAVSGSDGMVTLSRSQLDALLAAKAADEHSPNRSDQPR